MITLVAAAILLVPLAQAPSAPATGDAAAGKTLWEGGTALCRNCHGTKGEGAWGPPLAGRKLAFEQFRRAVRTPWGIMPAFIDSQITDKDLANLVAYFDSLPSVAQPGKARFEAPPDAPRGQQFAVGAVGCAQCHGPTMARMRQGLGALGTDFASFRELVYNHTTEILLDWKKLGVPGHHLMMGNYSPKQLPEAMLEEIFSFIRSLGYRPLIDGRFSAGAPAATGVTYTLDVENFGLRDKGLAAEDVTVAVVLPAGAEVVNAKGAGYQGVRADAELKANTAVWQLGRVGPKDRHSFTITLSKAGTASDNVRGVFRWKNPAAKAAPMETHNIPAAPLPAR